MKPVGQFDQNHPDIFRHRQKHLAIVFHLLFFFGLVLNPAQFGHAVDQSRNLAAKILFDLLQRHGGVFNDIMQQGRRDGVGVDLQLRQDPGHAQGMVDVVFAGNPMLTLMRTRSHGKRLLQQRNNRFRLVRANLGKNIGNVRSLFAGHSRTPSREIFGFTARLSPEIAWPFDIR